MDRRQFMQITSLAAGATLIGRSTSAAVNTPAARSPVIAPGGQPAVVTPNGSTLPWKIVGGVKVGHLITTPLQHEFGPGLTAEAWDTTAPRRDRRSKRSNAIASAST